VLLLTLILAVPLFAQQKYQKPEVYKKIVGKYTFYSGRDMSEPRQQSKKWKSGEAIKVEEPYTYQDSMIVIGMIDGINTQSAIFELNIYSSLYPTDFYFESGQEPVFSRTYGEGEYVVFEHEGNTYFNLISKGESSELNYLGDANAFLSGLIRQEVIIRTADAQTFTAFSDAFFSKMGTDNAFTAEVVGTVDINEDSSIHILYVTQNTLDKLAGITDNDTPFYENDNGQIKRRKASKLNNILGNFYAFKTVAELKDYIGPADIIGERSESGQQLLVRVGPDEESAYCAVVAETYDGTYNDGEKTYAKTKYGDINNVYAVCYNPSVGIETPRAAEKVLIEPVPGTNAYKTEAYRLELIDALGRMLKYVEGSGKPLTIDEVGAYFLRAREKNGRVTGSKGVVKTH
jgi:hypothetical protein